METFKKIIEKYGWFITTIIEFIFLSLLLDFAEDLEDRGHYYLMFLPYGIVVAILIKLTKDILK